jgi:plastocyanin
MRASSLLLPGLGAAVLAAAVALPAEGATTSVSVRDNVFAPKAKTVKRNDTVRFLWRGRNPHNVIISGPRRAASNVQVKGAYRYRATRPGLHRVVCTIHPGMAMRLRVR